MNTTVTLCSICGRVKWGNWVPLPRDRWRHEECALGSEAWREHYKGLSPVEKKLLSEFFNFSYPQVEEVQSCADVEKQSS